jgi:hypothetical protein
MRSTALLFGVCLLAGCYRAPQQPDQGNQAEPVTGTPVNGLTDQEQQGIIEQTRALLVTRHWKINPYMGPDNACSDLFTVGPGRIKDAMLGPQSGKVVVVFPITAQRYYDFGPNTTPRFYAPGDRCYGTDNNTTTWPIGTPVNVDFPVNVEKWQSGWRPSQQ